MQDFFEFNMWGIIATLLNTIILVIILLGIVFGFVLLWRAIRKGRRD